jgi:hypothetical protein
LVVAVSHFPELETALGLLRSGRSMSLTEGEADALWTRLCMASNLMAMHVPSSVARNPPNEAGE